MYYRSTLFIREEMKNLHVKVLLVDRPRHVYYYTYNQYEYYNAQHTIQNKTILFLNSIKNTYIYNPSFRSL